MNEQNTFDPREFARNARPFLHHISVLVKSYKHRYPAQLPGEYLLVNVIHAQKGNQHICCYIPVKNNIKTHFYSHSNVI